MTDNNKPRPSYRMQRDGDEFMFVWDERAIAIGFTQLYESHHELYGQIIVDSLLPDQPGRLHKSRLNLDAARSRAALVPTLERRVPKLPWSDMLEIACNKTEEAYRQGEPFINLAQDNEPDEEEEYLVYPLCVANSVNLIFGKGGVGKSYVAMMIALALQTGAALPSPLSTNDNYCNSMYLDWEWDRPTSRKRMRSLLLGMEAEWPDNFWYRRMRRPISADVTQLRAEIARRNIKFVVIDSIGPAVGGSLREEEMAIPTMNALRDLQVTVLAIAHVSKTSDDNGAEATPLGSVMFTNMARNMWELRRAEDTPKTILQIGLYHRKCNVGPLESRPLGIVLEIIKGGGITLVTPRSLDVSNVTDLTARGTLLFRLQSALRDGTKTADQLSKELGVKENVIRNRLADRKDLFVRLGDGVKGSPARWGLRSPSDELQESLPD